MRLLIGAGDSIHVCEYDTDSNTFERQAGRRVAGLGAFIPFGNQVVVHGLEGVRSLDPSLQHGSLLPVTSFASGAASASHLFLAGDGTVIVLDRELGEITRVNLGVGHKAAHDCMLVGTRLYLLDNIVHPVYVALVNTTDITNLSVLSTNEITAIYPHLDAQFVDLNERVWLVVQSTSHEGGSGQYLHWHSADSGQRLGDPVPIYFNRSGLMGTQDEEPRVRPWRFTDRIALGTADAAADADCPVRIHGSSGITPCWSVVSATLGAYYQRPFYLCRLSVAEGEAALDSFIPLSFSGDAGRIVVRAFRQWVVVVAEVFRRGEGARVSSLRLTTLREGRPAELVFDGSILADAQRGGTADFQDFQVWA